MSAPPHLGPQHLGTCWKWTFSGPTPDLLNQRLEWGPAAVLSQSGLVVPGARPILRIAGLLHIIEWEKVG